MKAQINPGLSLSLDDKRGSRQIEQLELLLGDIEESDAERRARTEASDGEASSTLPSKKPPVRTPLPDHLPLETVLHEAPCICPTCGATKFCRIGADERMVLEYVPSHFKRVLHVRPKMSCRACETVVQAPMPTRPIREGTPWAGAARPRSRAVVAISMPTPTRASPDFMKPIP